jgi:hypothetical protein
VKNIVAKDSGYGQILSFIFTSALRLGDALAGRDVRARLVFCDGRRAVTHEHRKLPTRH